MYQAAMRRVREYGEIENTPEGWQAFIDANPRAWNAPLWVAWRLHKRGIIECPDLIYTYLADGLNELGLMPNCGQLAALRHWCEASQHYGMEAPAGLEEYQNA